MRQLLLILLLACLAPALEEWELYHAPGDDAAALTTKVRELLPQGTSLKLHALPAAHTNTEELRLHARAMAAGVHTLPCLVLRDARGAYATLPLAQLSPAGLAHAQQLASAPDRDAESHRRTITAQLYLLCALMSLTDKDTDQDRITARMQELMQAPDTPHNLRQLIGMHGLYPALMQQYAAAYSGAHTPRSEAKLLEAIRVLEEVRDINPTSYLGRVAYDEREKLRAARLRSRQYE